MLHDVVGISKLDLNQEGEKLSVRLSVPRWKEKKKELKKAFQQDSKFKDKYEINKKIKSNLKNFYLLSQSEVHESVSDVARILLHRDYPEISTFDGKSGKTIQTFVPDGYIPPNPRIVEPQQKSNIKQQFQNDEKLVGEIIQTEGDIPEKKVYAA